MVFAASLFEEREDLVEDATLVALNVLEADHFAALSGREALAAPAFELLVVDAAPLERLAVDAFGPVDGHVVEHLRLRSRLEQRLVLLARIGESLVDQPRDRREYPDRLGASVRHDRP
jgi:hypothetical protein